MEFAQPEPILFSFNSPVGACPRCQGFGNTIDFDMDRVIPDTSLSLDDGAVDPWTKPKYRSWLGNFKKTPKASVRIDVPFCDLTADERDTSHDFVRRFFDHLESKKYKMHVRVFLSRYRGYALCPECKGARLRKEALYVRVGGKNLADIVRMNIAEAQEFFQRWSLARKRPHRREDPGGDPAAPQIPQRRRSGLPDAGPAGQTLSGGEAQRIQLATSLGSRLVGACYVLDEPSIGLHSRDTGRLIRILEELRDSATRLSSWNTIPT